MSALKLVAPSSLEYFESLVADDAHFPLLEAAAAVAHIDHPALDVQEVLAAIDRLSAKLTARLPADAAPMHRLRLLNQYFFRELGFAGNVNNYYDVGNSYIHRVLESRLGIPITLALLYIELATALGLHVRGVSFPGHFLVKAKLPGGEAVIDPFTGRSLSREELEERLVPYRRRQGLVGEFDAPLGLFLQAATPREILARLLGNLKEIHLTREDWPRLLAVQQRLVRVLPTVWEERRDRGMTHGELSDIDAAIDDLEQYLLHRPQAEDAASVRHRLEELRACRPSRLH
jgi:regulator of sirC expression with transglutaminase-like and TPR domain